MDFLYIDKQLCDLLKRHAVAEAPRECIGYFEAKPEVAGNLRVTAIVPCKNISKLKHTGDISKRDVKTIAELTKRNEKKGLVYGMYHSHPIEGSVDLSEKDAYIGKVYRRFRRQIILGVRGKSKQTVKVAFWFYAKPVWQEVEVIVKRRKDA